MPRSILVALISLSAAYFVLGTGSLAVIGLVGPMSQTLQTPPEHIAQLLTVFALTFAVAAPLGQVVLGHLPRRTLLLTGLVILSAASVAGAFAPSYGWLLATRIAAGMGAALLGPMASAIGAGLVKPEQQGRALAIVFGGMTLSIVLGVPLAAWTGTVLGWRAVLAGLGGAGFLVALAAVVCVKDRGCGLPVTLGGFMRVLGARRSGLTVATSLLQMAGQFATYALVTPWLADRYGVGGGWLIAVLLLFGVGGIVGNVLAGAVTDRIGADRTVGASLAGMAIIFVVLLVTPPWLPLGLLLMALWAVTGTLYQAPQQKRLAEIDPARRGLLFASNSSALYLGMSAGSLLAGIVYAHHGAVALPIASLVLMLLSGFAFRGSLAARPVTRA
ncbi:MAG: MFS transporter [Burkholderiales bacterium]|nr:MFS transporter [Burkholderiales bacterium]